MTAALITIERVALLHGVEFFRGVPTHVLASIAQHSQETTLGRGAVLIAEGEEGDCLYIIARGRVRIDRGGVALGELGAGEVVGELAVLCPGPRNASVTALEPSLFLRVGSEVIDELLLDHPEVTRSVIDVLVHRLRPVAADPVDHT